MTRRKAICSLLALGGAPLLAKAQQARIHRIGWLVTGSPASYEISLAAFLGGLEKLGYVDGRNIKVEYRWADGHLERLPGLAEELVQLRVDVILAGGTAGAAAAKNATREIPVVIAGVTGPDEVGLVTNLARPEGNLTGASAGAPATASKRLQLLLETAAGIKRVAIVWNSTNPNAQREWAAALDASKVLGLTLVSHDARTQEGLVDRLTGIPQARCDSIVVLNDPFVFTYRRTIAEAALRYGLPSAYGFREFVDAGGLMSYGASISQTYRRAASYVDKILKGARVADLPVEQPTTFELVINLKTAKALGITIQQSLLLRADDVIPAITGKR